MEYVGGCHILFNSCLVLLKENGKFSRLHGKYITILRNYKRSLLTVHTLTLDKLYLDMIINMQQNI